MTIELLSIGSEMLTGVTINTNAAFISQKLTREGFRVSRQVVVPDDPSIIRQVMEDALNRSQVVICTGGLGPTVDDLTRNVAAELLQSELVFNPEIAEELKQRYGKNHSAVIQDQATVPSKAALLKNSIGSAPGMIFEEKQKALILLPGVPIEMQMMFNEGVLTYLNSHFPTLKDFFCQRLHLFGLPESSVDPILRTLQPQYPKIEFGIYPAHGTLSVQLAIRGKGQKEALEQLAEPFNMIRKKFSANLFEASSGKIEEAIHNRFLEKGWTLSAAESCTGGSLSARLTQLPGTSKYFLGSIVCYSNQLKSSLLGISEKLLESKGAVRGEIAEALVRGLLVKTQSTYGIAITGIAGPDGGTVEKPVGTVWAAIAQQNKVPYVWKMELRGNREKIIDLSVTKVLSELFRFTNH